MQAIVILYCLQNNGRKSHAFVFSIGLFSAWGMGVVAIVSLSTDGCPMDGKPAVFLVVFLVLVHSFWVFNLSWWGGPVWYSSLVLVAGTYVRGCTQHGRLEN